MKYANGIIKVEYYQEMLNCDMPMTNEFCFEFIDKNDLIIKTQNLIKDLVLQTPCEFPKIQFEIKDIGCINYG